MNAPALDLHATSISSAARNAGIVRDISGYTVFANGEAGAAHGTAHRLLDSGRIALGHRMLGEWLDTHTGAGSNWVHLQFHMAVFELALGHWYAARARFLREVLPVAVTTEEALTDAPALLWRLAITAPGLFPLPWQQLRRTALRCMQRPCDPFVELHNLLALAGAGDVAGIEQWLHRRPDPGSVRSERLLARMALALQALAAGSYHEPATALEDIAPEIAQIGGSHAQNQLFDQLAEWCQRQAGGFSIAHAA